MVTEISSYTMDTGVGLSSGKLVECRICHDEDEESNLETPCACCGSLKYAHRQCVQRWCNEKGDTVCEICLQQFKPGYTAPPPLFHFGVVPFHLRGTWELPRRDHHNPHVISMMASERNFLDSGFEDYATPTPRTIMCCRIVITIFLVLLVLRHTLPIIVNGAGEYSFTLYTLLMLRTIGILLPIFVMLRLFTAIHHRRRRQQVADSVHLPTTDENEHSEPQLRFIRVQ